MAGAFQRGMDTATRSASVLLLALAACSPSGAPGPGARPDAGGPPKADAGPPPRPGSDAGPGRGPADAGDPDVCADVSLTTRHVTPTVVVVVDQSLSMDNELGSTTRWSAVHQALVGDAGVVTALQDKVRFGLALYSDVAGDATCPMVSQVPAGLGNRGPIDAHYRSHAPLGETPTGESIHAILDGLPPAGDDPTVLVLATDGNPDRCDDPDGHDDVARARSVQAVQRARGLGVDTYVIAVGRGTVAAAHLQELANTGVGRDGAPYWEAGDPAGLSEALSDIVRGGLSCTLELEGRVQAEAACMGTVTLNGRELPCDAEDGWRLVDESTIELTGAACEELLETESTVTASFPCYVVII